MMMKATTVVFEFIACNRWFRPAVSRSTTRLLTGKRLDEHVNTLVPELISTSSEHVDSVV